MVRVLARFLRAAGYTVFTDGPRTWEPRWDRPVVDTATGRQKIDGEGNPVWERARLDLRIEGGPDEPVTYVDVVISDPRAECWERMAALADGAVAEEHASRKHGRYPAELVPNARMVPFSVEAGGRLGAEALELLERAAGRGSQRHQGVAAAGDEAGGALLGSWLAQLSCVLQKCLAARLRTAGGTGAQDHQEPGPDGVEDDEDNEWLLDQIDALILQARTNAAADAGAN